MLDRSFFRLVIMGLAAAVGLVLLFVGCALDFGGAQ